MLVKSGRRSNRAVRLTSNIARELTVGSRVMSETGPFLYGPQDNRRSIGPLKGVWYTLTTYELPDGDKIQGVCDRLGGLPVLAVSLDGSPPELYGYQWFTKYRL